MLVPSPADATRSYFKPSKLLELCVEKECTIQDGLDTWRQSSKLYAALSSSLACALRTFAAGVVRKAWCVLRTFAANVEISLSLESIGFGVG